MAAGARAGFPRRRAQRALLALAERNPPPGGAHHRLGSPAEGYGPFPFPPVFPAGADELLPHRNNFAFVKPRQPPERERQHPAHLGIPLHRYPIPERAEERGPYRTTTGKGGIAPETLRGLCDCLHRGAAYRGEGGTEKGEKVPCYFRTFEAPDRPRGAAYYQRIGVGQRAGENREIIFSLGAAVLHQEDFLENPAVPGLPRHRRREPQKGDYEGKSRSHQARSEWDSRVIRGKNPIFPIVFIEKMSNFSLRQFFVPPQQSTFGPLTGDVSMAKKKKAAKKSAKRKVAKKSAKRKPSAAFMKPMQPSAALSEVVGSKPIPRTEVTKKLWQYIKRKNLQDKKNRRNINADANLKAVFGGKGTVNMFEMTKLVNKHLK